MGPRPARRVVGVEQELSVRRADGAPLDMRAFIDDLELDGRRLDPGDPHAVRGRWGGVLTADGNEAEIATPPVDLASGATVAIRSYLDAGEVVLRAALDGLDPGIELEGYSTHVSVEVADRRTVRCAEAVVRHFAPALMLMTDRRSSPGLLVRPRRHRVEVCTEHVDGDDLAAAIVIVGAAVVAVDDGLRRARSPRAVPPRVRMALAPSRERYGWFVSRDAFGADLYAEGRQMPLRVGRTTTSAGDHLAAAWASVRAVAEAQATDEELALVDARVAGRATLPSERDA